MSRANYEAEICQRLDQAERIPFREESTNGWRPTVANCHHNVDEWIKMNPSHSAVRGWVTYAHFGAEIGLTAHSVVRGADGAQFDITPLENEAERKQLREGMLFVEHLGSDEDFFALERECHVMKCPRAMEHFELCFDDSELRDDDDDPDCLPVL